MLLELALAAASASPLLQMPGQKPALRDFGKLYELKLPRAPKGKPERPCSIPLTQTLRPGEPQPAMKVIPAPRLHMRRAVLPAPPCKP